MHEHRSRIVFPVAIGSRGTDWIDLASNQTTMFYTSEGGQIKRFDVGSNTQLTDFANIGGVSFALRLLGDGGLLVANSTTIKRLDSTGAVIQTYDATGENSWFSLNLDPNGTSFWSGDFGTGNFYRFNIATCTQEDFVTTGSGSLFGLSVFGEVTQGGGGTIPEPATLALMGLGLAVARKRKPA